ncbi:MAG: hypothetical protein ACPG8W_19160 [Candidatus Promineifilaceae bacterium]
MDNLINWEESTRDGWRTYTNIYQLKENDLMNTTMVQACALDNDQKVHQAYAVRAVLDWGLLQLEQTGRVGAVRQAEVIQQRYVKSQTVMEVVVQLKWPKSTIKTRQRTGIKAIAKLLAQEDTALTGIDWYRPKSINLRIAALDPNVQPLLQFLAILRHPVPRRIALFAEGIPFQPYTQQLIAANLLKETGNGLILHNDVKAVVMQTVPIDIQLHNHTTAAQFYEQEGKIADAIYHWLHAGESEQGAMKLLAHSAELDTHTILHLLTLFANRQPLPRDLRARLNLLHGQTIEESADYEKSLETAIQLYKDALDTSDPLIQAEASYQLARAYYRRTPPDALPYYADAEQLLLDLTAEAAQRLLAKVYISRTWVYVDQLVDETLARADLESAEKLLNQGDKSKQWLQLRSDWHNAQGGFYRQQKQPKQSEAARRKASLFARQAHDVTRTIQTGYNLGLHYLRINQPIKAYNDLFECLGLAKEAGNSRMAALCNKALGACYVFDNEQYEKALAFYQAAYTHFQQSGNHWWLATTCYELVEALTMLGRLEEAMGYFEEGKQFISPNTKSAAIYAQLPKAFVELSADFTLPQRHIINHVRINDSITKLACHKRLGVSGRQALRELTELVEQNILQRIGKGRGTYYTFDPAFLTPN